MAMITGNYGGTSSGGSSTTSTVPSQDNTLSTIASLATIGSAIAGSDRRIKENIIPEGTKWKGLNIYTYNYIGDNVRRRGVMAQDVEGIYPDAVVTINGIKHVKYEEI
jgi:hypothetical protein